jgi:hypothetical protein
MEREKQCIQAFDIEIIEVLSRIVHIQAVDNSDAIKNVQALHEDGSIVLDWSDYNNIPVYQDINKINKCFNCNK